MNNTQILQAIVEQSDGVTVNDLSILNNGAPNSWTIYDKKNNIVWKILKKCSYNIDDYLLEKDALDRVPENQGIVKYIKTDFLNIVENGNPCKFPYFVFPYVDNSVPLDKLIKKRKDENNPFSNEEIIDLGKQVIGFISILFKSNVVHQDIKPGNILIDDKGKVFLIDLGIAMFVDSDLQEIKKMKGPYAYLSPEKLDLIANLSSFNKRNLSFTSDLFSLGMVLFEMATFNRLSDLIEPGEIRKAYLDLSKFNINADINEKIASLLDEDILRRERRVSKNYGINFYDEVNSENITFWIQHSSNGIKYIDQYIEQHKFELPWGIIMSADNIQGEKNEETFISRAGLIKEKGGLVAIDPTTFRLRYDDEHHSYLVNRDYWQIVSSGIFLKKSLIKKGIAFTEEVIKFEEKFNPDIYISPYFILENTEDNWLDATFSCYDQFSLIGDSKNITDKLYFGLFLSERLIFNDNAVNKILAQIILNKKIKNIYLRFESIRKDSSPSENPTYLNNVKNIISTLSKYKNILLGYSGIESLGLFSYGLSSIGINPDYSKRKCQIIEVMSKVKVSVPTPDKKPRYFAQNLINEILTREELANPLGLKLGSDQILKCGCPFCFSEEKDQRLNSDEVRKHFLWNFEKLVSGFNAKSSEDQKKVFIEMLNKANDSYIFLEEECKIIFTKSTDSSFIPIWKAIFN